MRIPFDDFLNLRKHLCTISADYQVFSHGHCQSL
nr:MAG TPA: hypothetical protein [Caudoviricetes sp.]DAT30315.1 MAG TPA: hypothetical protein [Caudoviricetes sp.]DAU09626.1 MAG TPA: hypothetical protein [Caudoviricetes sp.]